nr:hypothetical protein YKMJLDLN_YKMJLDLN_CDS_0007 [Microvirus sp.]
MSGGKGADRPPILEPGRAACPILDLYTLSDTLSIAQAYERISAVRRPGHN